MVMMTNRSVAHAQSQGKKRGRSLTREPKALPEILGTRNCDGIIAVLAARAKGERLGCASHLASPMPASEGALQKSACVDSAQRLSPREGSGEGMKNPKP